jgi:hypothetical protein
MVIAAGMRRPARLRWRRTQRAGDGNRSVLISAKTLAMDSSVIEAVEPAPVNRGVLSTFANVPRNARCLIVSQVASTARQDYQRRPNERGFDDGEHARDPRFIGFQYICGGHECPEEDIPPQRWNESPQKQPRSAVLWCQPRPTLALSSIYLTYRKALLMRFSCGRPHSE